jgi:hypothetical protein
MTEGFRPISISPEGLFLGNVDRMTTTWIALTSGKFPHHSASLPELRARSGYSHHFAFFYQLLTPDKLDERIVGTAVGHLYGEAMRLYPWDGGKALWERWPGRRDALIEEFQGEELREWVQKYAVIRPELFDGDIADDGKVRAAIRRHADHYMGIILGHATELRNEMTLDCGSLLRT